MSGPGGGGGERCQGCDRRWGDRANLKGRCQESEKETKAARLEPGSWEEDGEATHQGPREEQVWKDEKGKAAGSEP